ncbi:hypothetical protein AAFC00_001852 [Neodothiora populina]|uniref:Ribonuclease P/MRP protein subunit POP5 n=1 Tax=Neodothiora populina TaxID=2781224 RepID=A0ABR3PQC1_9PEZI
MVRLKHRYLLVNILYPDATPSTTTAEIYGSAAAAAAAAGRDVARDVPDIIHFQQPTSDKLTPQLLAKMVKEGVAELFGDYGSGMVAGSLVVKYLSPATSTAIIRVSRDHYRLVWAALSFITKLPRPIEQNCVVQVVRVSGTIRKAEEEAIKRAKLSILRAQRKSGEAGSALGKLLSKEDEDMRMSGIVDGDGNGDDDDLDD